MFKSKKSFPSPTVLTVLHIIRAEGKTSPPHREPSQSASQEANENGHSHQKRTNPETQAHILTDRNKRTYKICIY